jgi:hypothetical protein
MSDTTLIQMLDEVRGSTLHLLSVVDEPTARWRPPGLQNHILWHAGHCYAVVEWLTMESLGREPQSPPGWFEMFGWDSRPASVPPDRWPALSEAVRLLRQQHVRLRQLFAELSDAQLSQPEASGGATVRQRILHALQDEASHKGEMWLLYKLQKRAYQSEK